MTESDSTQPLTRPAQKAFENVNAGGDIKADIRQESNIRIEESAVGSAIVSGDGNTIYVIHQTTEQWRESSRTDTAVSIGPNPYKGLAAFTENDADRYFGREGQVKRLWQRFWDLVEQSGRADAVPRFLPILGPSGCGKSSLARAGFVPELARRPLPGKERMRVAVLVPGTHPVESLAGVLAKVATQDPMPVTKTREFTTELNLPTAAGLYDGMRRIADLMPQIKDSPLVVLVDQFEEVYSLCEDTNERQAFVENLLCAASDPTGNLSVIITLRSDFLGETQRHPMLNQVISSDQSVIVPAMAEAELRRAIAEPAKQAGHPLDEAVVDLLVKDTEGREGALPLLQFALTRIWEGLGEGTPPAETYRQMGGVGGALAGKAQEIYDKLPEAEKDIARRIFIGLVQLGEGTRDTRRRAAIENLMGSQDRPETLQQVLDRFSSPGARLITLSSQANQETAEVTHEALIRYWRLLRRWIEQNRDLIRQQRRIEANTVIWQDNHQYKRYLLEGWSLKEAIRFQQQQADTFPLSEPTVTFITKSKQQRRWKQIKTASWLIIPALVVVGIVEHNIRQQKVRADIGRIDDNEGGSEEKYAVEDLVRGCRRRVPRPEQNWLGNYIGERIMRGNCRSLSRFNLSYADLNHADLSDADISEANLYFAKLHTANLRDVNLHYANLRDAKLILADLNHADLNHADLSDADLSGANLSDANLSGAKLSCAKLSDVPLYYANLSYANLSGADLSGAKLSGAKLRYANLSGADLSFTDLNGAILLATDLRDANLTIQQLTGESRPYLCNVALPDTLTVIEPDALRFRDCADLPKILEDLHGIANAQWTVSTAMLQQWE